MLTQIPHYYLKLRVDRMEPGVLAFPQISSNVQLLLIPSGGPSLFQLSKARVCGSPLASRIRVACLLIILVISSLVYSFHDAAGFVITLISHDSSPSLLFTASTWLLRFSMMVQGTLKYHFAHVKSHLCHHCSDVQPSSPRGPRKLITNIFQHTQKYIFTNLKKTRCNFDLFTMDGYCRVGGCHFCIRQCKGKEVSDPD